MTFSSSNAIIICNFRKLKICLGRSELSVYTASSDRLYINPTEVGIQGVAKEMATATPGSCRPHQEAQLEQEAKNRRHTNIVTRILVAAILVAIAIGIYIPLARDHNNKTKMEYSGVSSICVQNDLTFVGPRGITAWYLYERREQTAELLFALRPDQPAPHPGQTIKIKVHNARWGESHGKQSRFRRGYTPSPEWAVFKVEDVSYGSVFKRLPWGTSEAWRVCATYQRLE